MEVEKLKKAFEKNGYLFSCFQNATQASQYLNQQLDNKYVGFGDSQTLTALKLYDSLGKHNKVVDPQHCNNSFIETAKECLTTEIFITSVNAASKTGELVNIDGTGNRIAGSLFGHEKVYFVFGKNKLEPTIELAINRARNVAAPKNAKRLGTKTPCAIKGDKCYNCSSPERICNGLILYLKKMDSVYMEIVLINEDMGL